MAVGYRIPRGTRASLNAKASAGTILVGQLYLVTDENRVAVGVTTTSTVDLNPAASAATSAPYLDLTSTAPGLPASGSARIFRADVGGREMVRVVGDDGDFATMQPHMGRNNPHMLTPTFGTTLPSLSGFPAASNIGTPTARSWSSATRATRTRRFGLVTAATQNSYAAYYFTIPLCSTGDSSTGSGGFHFITRFCAADTNTTTRMFVGMANSTAAPSGTAEVNALTYHVGVGKLSTSSNLCVVSSGSAAQPIIDLGSSYPGATNTADFYELVLFAPSSTAPISWLVTRFLSDGTSINTSGVFGSGTTITPAATIGLAPRWWRQTSTATACALDIAGAYLETDI